MKRSLFVLWFALWAGAAVAQPAPTPQASPNFYATAASLSVSGTTANVALPSAPSGGTQSYPAALVMNVGSVEAFFVLGASGVTATTAGIPVEPGQCVPVWVGAPSVAGTQPTNLAAITASGSTMLRVAQATSLAACNGGIANVTASISGTITTTPAATTPSGGGTTASISGSTTIVTGPINGGYVVNPPDATSQGIATAEPICLDPTSPSGSVPVPGASCNGTATEVQAGQPFTLPPLASGIAVKVNAATSAHKITVVKW